MLVGAFLVLVQTAVALPPVICDGPSADDGPRYACLADARASNACIHQADDDARPFTLCLAEEYDDDIERELGVRLDAAFRRESVSNAVRTPHLRIEQKRWQRQRERTCRAEAEAAPVPEQARAELTCRARLAEPRIAYLTELANGDRP